MIIMEHFLCAMVPDESAERWLRKDRVESRV